MKFEETSLHHVWLIKPRRFKDERGEFLETFRVELFKEHGLEFEFVQEEQPWNIKILSDLQDED